jgi:diaminopimelate decarboxylase
MPNSRKMKDMLVRIARRRSTYPDSRNAFSAHKIATGRKEDKFGIDIALAPALYARAATLPSLKPVGIAVHIGSQLTTLDPFRAAFTRVADLVHSLRATGLPVIVWESATP